MKDKEKLKENISNVDLIEKNKIDSLENSTTNKETTLNSISTTNEDSTKDLSILSLISGINSDSVSNVELIESKLKENNNNDKFNNNCIDYNKHDNIDTDKDTINESNKVVLKDLENVEDIQDVEDVEDIQDVEDVEDIQDVEDVEDVEDKKKKLNTKNNKFNLRFYISILSAIGIGVSSYIGAEIGSYIRNEEERLKNINLDNINLQLIVDTTDNLGKDMYQLNWKEIFALVSVFNDNYNSNITEDNIIEVGNLFIANGKVKSFTEVVENLELSDIKKERAYKYLKDLENYGFKPERLIPDGEQMTFINSIKDIAIDNYYESKILPSITIAQAILESNWGKSSLTVEANNLFGIKADKSWKGEYAIFDTKEYHDIFIKDKFRKYNSLEDSVKDHSTFLMQHDRYKEHKVFEAKTYKQQALALENAGYSTAQDEHGNKTYAKMLGELIRQYNLQIIDASVLNK